MDIDSETRDATPPLKRRKTSGEALPAFDSQHVANAEDRRDAIDQRKSSVTPETPSRQVWEDERNRDRSRSRRRSRDRSYTRSEATSRSPSRRPFPSRSPSPSESQYRSPSGYQDRTRSQSLQRSRSESFSPDQAQNPAAREELRPNYQPRMVLRGHSGAVSQVRISPNGKFIASAAADETIKIWDAATGAHMDTLVGHMAGVSCIAWSPDSNTIASGSDDKAIRLWDRVTGRPKITTRRSTSGKEMAPLRGHHNYVHCVAFSPKGNILASGSYDEAVFLWDVRAGRLMRSLPAHSDPVSGIDICQDGTLVVSCSTDGLIRVWDTSTGQCLRTLVHEDNPAVTNVCFSPNGRFVLAFNLDNCIRLWDYVSGSVKKTYQGHRNEKFAIGGCFGTLGGEAFVASASEDGGIVLWDVKSKDILQRVDGHEGVCFWVDIHGELMVSAGQDHTIRVYRHTSRDSGDGEAVDGVDNVVPEAKQNGVAESVATLPIRVDDVGMEDA